MDLELSLNCNLASSTRSCNQQQYSCLRTPITTSMHIIPVVTNKKTMHLFCHVWDSIAKTERPRFIAVAATVLPYLKSHL